MGDHLIGIAHLGEVVPLVAGLLARPALGLAALGPIRRRFGQSFGRGRHRGVAGIAPHAPFEFDDLGLQLGKTHRLLFDQKLLSSNQFLEFLEEGVVEFHDHQSTRCTSRSRAFWDQNAGRLCATFKSRRSRRPSSDDPRCAGDRRA